ncbi:hypothetical protein [Leisingera sp. HS039]|uniref:hypothetical protein n=1 Tax=Leisingera sp. HS039 TaxID=2818496 RepID=UPI001B39F834|nr:hypothetical protein [Leisingera sp. HS039]
MRGDCLFSLIALWRFLLGLIAYGQTWQGGTGQLCGVQFCAKLFVGRIIKAVLRANAEVARFFNVTAPHQLSVSSKNKIQLPYGTKFDAAKGMSAQRK